MSAMRCLRRRAGLALALTAISVCACKGSTTPTAPSSPSPALPPELVFTNSPLSEPEITSIIPLGNLNPPGHTLPTGHIYFWRAGSGLPVVAPAAGVVTDVSRTGAGALADGAVSVDAATGVTYTIGHVVPDASIVRGALLTGGQPMGVTGLSNALDLGVLNQAITLFFVRPERYIPATIHADSPLKYFQEPTRSALYAKVRRHADDKDGKIDFDRPGHLAGNWFLEGLPVQDTENVMNGPKHLAFVRDVEEPSLIRISIGGSLSISGAFYTADGVADPADVTPASGVVSYRLFAEPGRFGTGVGLAIVQMLADDRLEIETFPGDVTSASFTPAALVYER